MADPFSIATGACSIVDICVRVGSYLKTLNGTAKEVEQEIGSLQQEIDKFSSTYTALEQLCSSGLASPVAAGPGSKTNPNTTLWSRAADLVKEGNVVVENLKEVLTKIIGNETQGDVGKVDKVRKAIRILSHDEYYKKLRQRLTNLNLELGTMLTAIDLTSSEVFRSDTKDALEQMPRKMSRQVQELGLQLRTQIHDLELTQKSVGPSIDSAKEAIFFASLNQHFYVQNPDISIWTGRQKALEQVMRALLRVESANNYRQQKRFVVHGIAGAGKTQFCCKLAQDYRENFWGIFWIDASSKANADESWKRIGKIAERDANQHAAKHWLSNLQTPWLLIIDGADDSEETVQSQFPVGDRGCVIVTTRNPRVRVTANVGSISLDSLEEKEANDLLRKATQHLPWDDSAKKSSASIAKHLGYLPLALIHAGRAICHRLCTLQDYIPFFNRTLDYLRKKDLMLRLSENDELCMGALTSFDIMYSGMEAYAQRPGIQAERWQDAIELMNMFSFWHNSDIRMETITRASSNLQQLARLGVNGAGSTSKNLSQRLLAWATEIITSWVAPAPVLPHILRDRGNGTSLLDRVRRATDALVRMSMLSESSEPGCYSIHPLVHVWMRNRLGIAEQCVWSEIAANVLASSIKIPPLADEQGDQDHRLRLLTHVNEVQAFQKGIRVELESRTLQARASTWHSMVWPTQNDAISTVTAANNARFSRVYLELGFWSEAKALQEPVRDLLLARRGPDHPYSIQIQLALARVLLELGEMQEAAAIQESVVQACQASKGEARLQTFKAMDALGETRWRLGQFLEAKECLEIAVEGMRASLGSPQSHRDLLTALDHLGRVQAKYFHLDEAEALHREAVEGLRTRFGDRDIDALVAMDNLAMTLTV